VFVSSSSADVKTLIALTFCDEGDNTQDAIDLVSYVNTMTKWIPPSDSQVVLSPLLFTLLHWAVAH